jgi:hypothetical protein
MKLAELVGATVSRQYVMRDQPMARRVPGVFQFQRLPELSAGEQYVAILEIEDKPPSVDVPEIIDKRYHS